MVEQLVHHFQEAGDLDISLKYLVASGQKSLDVYAIDSARHQFMSALSLTKLAPDRLAKSDFLDLVLFCVRMLTLDGAVVPATDLCEEYASLFELAESRTHLALYPAYFGFCLLNLARFEQAKRVLQRGVNVAEEVHDEVSLAHSYMSLGMTEFITNPYNDDNRAKAIAMVKSASMTGRRVGD
ncbi:MAG: hypothetical protein QGF53_00270, partial [Alphaproteobacteria bacterium]|nr:hypothetical protein [Alphaproteobacteria bacterium]